MTKQKPRRVPKQARSIRRYNHILDTAARLFEEKGVDQVSTNHIAAEAEVSIGSLYQFFPNKEAILEGLVARYMQDFEAVFPQEIDRAAPIETVIRHVLTQFVSFNRQNKGFQTILVGLEGTSNAGTEAEMTALIIGNIDRVLAAYYPTLAPDRRKLCATVSLSLVAGMMPVPLPPEMMVDEMLLAVTAYQQAFVMRESQLTPPSQN